MRACQEAETRFSTWKRDKASLNSPLASSPEVMTRKRRSTRRSTNRRMAVGPVNCAFIADSSSDGDAKDNDGEMFDAPHVQLSFDALRALCLSWTRSRLSDREVHVMAVDRS